jgi:Domain of unknown function (DUF336).
MCGKLTASDCDRILAAAEARAREINVPMVIAIVDESGLLKAFKRMDGSLLISVKVAQGKAYTAAALRMSTREVGERTQPGADIYGMQFADVGNIISFGGGFPLIRNGELIGGIGVSGGSCEEDEDVARAGMAALEP